MYTTINAKTPVFKQGVHYATDLFGQLADRYHGGIDMIGKAYAGDYIIAFADGTVAENGYDANVKGNYVVIKHYNSETHYYHMRERSALAVGQTINAGDTIGYMGSTGWSTGPHLHFGVKVNGVFVDPRPYLEGTATLPAPAPAPEPQPVQQDYIAYKVKPGDSWWQIAQDKLGDGNRYMELVQFNGHSTAPKIYPGDIIKIPGSSSSQPAPQRTHKVGVGESYWSIAEDELGNGSRWQEIKALNGNKEVIHPGDALKIPN